MEQGQGAEGERKGARECRYGSNTSAHGAWQGQQQERHGQKAEGGRMLARGRSWGREQGRELAGGGGDGKSARELG